MRRVPALVLLVGASMVPSLTRADVAFVGSGGLSLGAVPMSQRTFEPSGSPFVPNGRDLGTPIILALDTTAGVRLGSLLLGGWFSIGAGNAPRGRFTRTDGVVWYPTGSSDYFAGGLEALWRVRLRGEVEARLGGRFGGAFAQVDLERVVPLDSSSYAGRARSAELFLGPTEAIVWRFLAGTITWDVLHPGTVSVGARVQLDL